MKQALFPISADPITYGHLDIIRKALRLCEEKLIVVILENYSKKPLFPLSERVALSKRAIEVAFQQLPPTHAADQNDAIKDVTKNTIKNTILGLEKIEIIPWEGMLHHLMLERGVFHIIRGLRGSQDLDHERAIAKGYQSQLRPRDLQMPSAHLPPTPPQTPLPGSEAPEMTLVYLICEEAHQNISSSLVKSMAAHNGDVRSFVPTPVKQSLERSLLQQNKLIITGAVGSGKSTIIPKLIDALRTHNIEVHAINTDAIVAEIYQTLEAGGFHALAAKLQTYFNAPPPLSKKIVARLVFDASEEDAQRHLQFLEATLAPYIHSARHKQLQGKQGLILIEAPQAAEYYMLEESNGFVLFVTCNEAERLRRLKENRGWSLDEARKRMNLSTPENKKLARVKQGVANLHYGEVLTYDNSRPDNFSEIDALSQRLIEILSLQHRA